MKNKKKRVLFITVVMVVILCMSSTALATGTRNYARGSYDTTFSYGWTTSMQTSLVDDNTRCYFASGANEYTTGYTSRLMVNQVFANQDLGGVYQYNAQHNDSGETVRFGYSNQWGHYTNGQLSFRNSDAPGYYLSVKGSATFA